MKTMVIAHRGASYLSDFENTLDSFQLAIELGADMVEFDVRETSDHQLIVFHDSTFCDVPIAWQKYEEIEKDANEKGFHIPRFEEVLELCAGKILMDIEIKESGFEKEVVKLVRKKCKYSQYSIKSFHDIVVLKIKCLDKNIRTGLLLGRENAKINRRFNEVFPLRRLRLCKADFVSPHYSIVNRLFLNAMHKHGYPVYAWTVNDTAKMEKLLRKNVDAIISDKPDAVLVMRNKLQPDKEEN